jgi:hypothetical protein
MGCTCLPQITDPFCPTDGKPPTVRRRDRVIGLIRSLARSRYILPLTLALILATFLVGPCVLGAMQGG